MSFIRFIGSQWHRNLHSLHHHAYQRNHPAGSRLPSATVFHHLSSYSDNPASRYNHRFQHTTSFTKIKTRATAPTLPSPPPPRRPRFNLPQWTKWFLGSLMTLLMPFWGIKWKKLLKLESDVEIAADIVEEAAGVVEKTAIMVEKVSSDVAEKFADNATIKDAALAIEHVSEEAAKEAHLAKDIIHKVDELKQEVEELLEPVTQPHKLPSTVECSDGTMKKSSL